MKKIFISVFMLLYFIILFYPAVGIYAANCPVSNSTECPFQYSIAGMSGDLDVQSFVTYSEALVAAKAYTSSETQVAVIKNISDKIIYAEFGMVLMYKFDEYLGDNLVKMYGDAGLTSYRTYVHREWGTDAAFIDYNSTYLSAKIKISGFSGWVSATNIIIIPISKYYNKSVYIESSTSITVRDGASTNNAAIPGAFATNGSTYKVLDETINQGYTWYKIQYSDTVIGWIASRDSTWTTTKTTVNLSTFYMSNNNVLSHTYLTKTGQPTLKLGTAPFHYTAPLVKNFYLKNGDKYYSFDGNYFYTSVYQMLKDYKSNEYSNSINYDNPYFAYFMYLPSHSISGYTASTFNQVIVNNNYTASPVNPKSYINPVNGTWLKVREPNLSQMYGLGNSFISAASNNNANALTIFVNAIIESGFGTSSIAFYKNNLFGLGAADGSPFYLANTYNTLSDSINAYASYIGNGSSYSNPYDYRYAGTHQGNKLSGVKVWYLSDPYGGEKASQMAYNIDSNYGFLDNYSSTIGVKIKSTNVSIYKEPTLNSPIILEIKNFYGNPVILENIPFTVIDKVYVTENNITQGYYKVYTDVALSADRTRIDTNNPYSFNNCYGYIKVEDLYVQNTQPVITASNVSVEQGKTINLMSGVSANDYENGNLTSSITYTGTVNLQVPGVYPITYSVKDTSNFNASKTINVTVTPSIVPIITAPDVTLPQYTAFDELAGVSIQDEDLDIMSKLVISGLDELNLTQTGTYQLIYTVTNSKGYTTIKNRNVTVITNEHPEISAKNVTLLVGDTYLPTSGVMAFDKEDGDITSSMVLTGTVDTGVAGNYQVTYTSTDNANQTTIKTITVVVEAKKYTAKEGMFHLEKILFNSTTKKLDFTGFLVLKGINNAMSTPITYDLILEDQYDNEIFISPLSRLTSNLPFAVPNDAGLDYSGAWFSKSIDLSTIGVGDYTVYVRARSGDFETKVLLKNVLFNTNVSRKFSDGTNTFLLKNNFYNKNMPLELFVRDDGLLNITNNPTIDNMYNQVYSMSFTGTNLNIVGTSHNVNGNYAALTTVTRNLVIENIKTLKIAKTQSIGSVTNGPYAISLRVSDNLDKTKAWYNTSVDLGTLDVGRYAIYIKTKTGAIEDSGELYDILFKNINMSASSSTKNISIVRNNDKRYRIEIIVEAK